MPGAFDAHPKNIGTLLGQYEVRQIIVPEFQRGYSWEKPHVSSFWEDLDTFRRNRKTGETYFLGPIVLIPGVEDVTLLDGQQRLATATILLSCLRDAARQLSPSTSDPAPGDFARDVQKELIEKKQKGKYALVLGDLDRFYFSNAVQNDPPKKTEARLRSHANIRNAKEYLSEAVDKSINGLSPIAAIERLTEVKDSLVTAVVMVSIEVSSEDDAFSIFETLNDRGLRLSVPDLLLNHLMRKAGSNDQKKEVREKWDAMLERMGKRDIDAFLRHMWISRYGDVKARGLFREMKSKLATDSVSSVDFAAECNDECETYSSILELSPKVLGKAAPHVAGLTKYLGAMSSLPLLLSGLRCLSAADFERLAKTAVDLYVRHAVFANANPSDLETALYAAARTVRERKKVKGAKSAACLADAQAALATVNPTDPQVEAGADELLLTRREAQYLLTQLANSKQSKTKEVAIDDANLEHVFPLNPNKDEWTNQAELDEYKWHLGNLTVLSTRLNREASNSGFDKKKKLYAASELKMAQEIAAQAGWNKAAVLARAKLLASEAAKVWTGPAKASKNQKATAP